MSTVQYAIASIVEANTRFGIHGTPHRIHYASADKAARSLRSSDFTRMLKRIGQKITAGISKLQRYHEYRNGVNQLAALNDHNLEDIGITRADAIALQLKQIDVTELEQRRAANRGKLRVSLTTPISRVNPHRDSAANEAVYADVKCA